MTLKWGLAVVGVIALAWIVYPVVTGPGAPMTSAAPTAGTTPAVGTTDAADRSTCDADAGAAKLDFTLTDMDGRNVNLAEYKGRPVLLNFWATWCGPCKVEIPAFVELQDKYRDQGFAVLGVSIDDPPEALQSFAKEFKMNYPVLQISPEFEASYGPIYGIPISYLIKRDGTICRRHIGPAGQEEFERDIKALL